MIQKLAQSDVTRLITYLSKDDVPNLFFIANTENYGLESENIEVFVNVLENKIWDFALMRYFSITLIYSQQECYDIREAVKLIDTFEKVDTIGGKHSVVEQLKNSFPAFKFRPTTLLSCTNESLVEPKSSSSFNLEVLSNDKGDELYDFYMTIEEFAKNYKGQENRFRERTKENLQKDSRAYVFTDNNTIISSAQAGAQCSVGSMLLGVATNPQYRKQGLASILVSKACEDQFEKGRNFVALFFDNPEAGSLYKKLGFNEVGQYTVLQNNT